MTFDVSLAAPYHRFGGIDAIAAAAEFADDLGYFGVAMGEHLVTPPGRALEIEGSVYYDFFVLAAYLAARTTRIRLISAVSIVPVRHPIVQAKQWATLDHVSGGRAILGAGGGSTEEDQRVVGLQVPFRERSAVTEEYLLAMKALWTEESPSFSGKYVQFEGVEFEPKCLQQPHVPIWIAGSGGAASLSQVARFGDGWLTNELHGRRSLGERIERVKAKALSYGRDPSALVFGVGLGVGPAGPGERRGQLSQTSFYKYFPPDPADTSARTVDLIRRFTDQGINHVSLRFHWQTTRDFLDRLEWFADTVMPAFAGS